VSNTNEERAITIREEIMKVEKIKRGKDKKKSVGGVCDRESRWRGPSRALIGHNGLSF